MFLNLAVTEITVEMLLSQALLCLGKQPLSQYQMRHIYLGINLSLLHTFGKKKPQMSHSIISIMEILTVKQKTINQLTQEITQVPRCLGLSLYIEGICANGPLHFLDIHSQLLVLFFCIYLSTSKDILLLQKAASECVESITSFTD